MLLPFLLKRFRPAPIGPDVVFPTGGILLASEGRAISDAALAEVKKRAFEGALPVFVFSVARIWGTSFGLPNPGLMPTRPEWDAQHKSVSDAVLSLRSAGLAAEGRVLATRNPVKSIVREAVAQQSREIVMGADRPVNRFFASIIWSQQPHAVKQMAQVPVTLVID